jgi:hypothetical protein
LALRFDQRDLRGLGPGRDHPAFVLLLQFGDAAGMVAVMVGHQDVGELPAGLLQRGLDGRGFRRVDRRGCAARRVVDQHAVIVVQAAEQLGLGGHVGTSFSGLADRITNGRLF